MHISHLKVRNFRALADIECDLRPEINVVVGPNGVGKTTILSAVRLTKALLAPRTQNEPNQFLISIGAASPHFPQRLFLKNLARDENAIVDVKCTFSLTQSEIDQVKSSATNLAQSIVAQRFGQGFANPAMLIQFMQSPQGIEAMAAVQKELDAELPRLERDRSLVLGITIDGKTGTIQPANLLAGPIIGHLDQMLPPSTSLFSYFPADRALPIGEVNMQIGGPDVQQQIESHNSQPQLKYQRLKTLIINSMVLEDGGGANLKDEFQKIFSGILRGRKLHSVSVNEIGLLSVLTEEESTGRVIDLDSLSSGEKNVVLTFLLVSRTVHQGGIVLFDEPELHLNPSVSRDMLSFMISEYAVSKDVQFVMCTHSPEIVSEAFSSEHCNLLHLKSADEISRVGRRALDEYADALQRLGTSVTDSMMYKGTILVEGPDDVEFLKAAFPDLTGGFKLSAVGGRTGVEQAIRDLQALEGKGEPISPIFMVFDLDEAPTSLIPSKSVRFLQWPKRSLENYLIDLDVLTELLKDESVTRSPLGSEAEVHKRAHDLAFQQLNAIAARDVYRSYGYKNPSLMKQDIDDTSMEDIAQRLFVRMESARSSMRSEKQEDWQARFLTESSKRRYELSLLWDSKWRDLCDGKKLISDLHKASDLKMSESTFKVRIAQRMREVGSDNWVLVKGLLEKLLGG